MRILSPNTASDWISGREPSVFRAYHGPEGAQRVSFCQLHNNASCNVQQPNAYMYCPILTIHRDWSTGFSPTSNRKQAAEITQQLARYKISDTGVNSPCGLLFARKHSIESLYNLVPNISTGTGHLRHGFDTFVFC
eukprot:6204871-Pleurochrysis_carterae.AAC.6